MYNISESESIDERLLNYLIATIRFAQKHGDRAFTLLLGAGCSLSSAKDGQDISTTGLMRTFLRDAGIPNDHISGQQLYNTFVEYWQRINVAAKQRFLHDQLGDLVPGRGYEALAELVKMGYVNSIITTNFDTCIDQCLQDVSVQRITGEDACSKPPSENTCKLIKVHGDLLSKEVLFSPRELSRLPDLLHKEIELATQDLVVVIGYSGQDHGLMNALSRNDASPVYWIAKDRLDLSTEIYAGAAREWLESRKSSNNIIAGDDYGDFDKALTLINARLKSGAKNQIFLQDHSFPQLSMWRRTIVAERISDAPRFEAIINAILYTLYDLCDRQEKQWHAPPIYSNLPEKLILEYFISAFSDQVMPQRLLDDIRTPIEATVIVIIIHLSLAARGRQTSPLHLVRLLRNEITLNIKEFGIDEGFWTVVEAILEAKSIEVAQANIDIYIEQGARFFVGSAPVNASNMHGILQIAELWALLSAPDIVPDGLSGSILAAQTLRQSVLSITASEKSLLLQLQRIDRSQLDAIRQQLEIPENNVNVENGIMFNKWIVVKFEALEDDIINDRAYSEQPLKEVIEQIRRFAQISQSNFRESMEWGKGKNILPLQHDKEIDHFVAGRKVALFLVGASGSGKSSSIKRLLDDRLTEVVTIIVHRMQDFSKQRFEFFDLLGIPEFQTECAPKTSDINRFQQIFTYLPRSRRFLIVLDGLNELGDDINSILFAYQSLNELINELPFPDNEIPPFKFLITCRPTTFEYLLSRRGFPPLSRCWTSIDAAGTICPYISSHVLNLNEKTALWQSYTGSTEIPIQVSQIDLPIFIALFAEIWKQGSDSPVAKSNNIYESYINLKISSLPQSRRSAAIRVLESLAALYVESLGETEGGSEIRIRQMGQLQPADIDSGFHDLADLGVCRIFQRQINRLLYFSHDRFLEYCVGEFLSDNIEKSNLFGGLVSAFPYKGTLQASVRHALLCAFSHVLGNLPVRRDHINRLFRTILEASRPNVEIFSAIFVEAMIDTFAEYSDNIRREGRSWLREGGRPRATIDKEDRDLFWQVFPLFERGMDRALNPANGGKARVLIIWLYAGCKSVAGRKSECAALLALLARAEELDIDDGGASNYTREWLLRVANMARHHAFAYGKPRTQSIALRHLANLHSRFGDKRKAVELLEQSYQNAVSSGEVVEAAAMALDLGMALRDFGRFREVINLYDELIRKFGSLLPDPEVMRANLQKAIATKNILYDIVIDEAVEEYEEIIDPNIAWKLFETATELQKEVLHWAREHVNRPLEAEALSDLAETHFIMSVIRSEYWDRFVGYMKEFSECLLIYPDPRRKIEYHRYMTELFVRQGQITKAFRENRVGAELALAARLRFEQFDCDLQLARLVAEMDVSRMSTNLFSEADAAARQAEQYFEDYGMTDSRYYRLAVKIRQVLSRKT